MSIQWSSFLTTIMKRTLMGSSTKTFVGNLFCSFLLNFSYFLMSRRRLGSLIFCTVTFFTISLRCVIYVYKEVGNLFLPPYISHTYLSSTSHLLFSLSHGFFLFLHKEIPRLSEFPRSRCSSRISQPFTPSVCKQRDQDIQRS